MPRLSPVFFRTAWILTAVLLTGVLGFSVLLFLNRNRHQHCIKAAGLALYAYAVDHGGAYPTSPHGYADALLELVRKGYLKDADLSILTAPGGSTKPYWDALKSNTPPTEAEVSRVYVQGLDIHQSQPEDLLLLFDKESNHGDHGPGFPVCLLRPKVREATITGGLLVVIPEDRWPEVVAKNIQYLRERGFSESEISKFYD